MKRTVTENKQTCFDNKSRHNEYNVINFLLNKRASIKPAETRFNSAISRRKKKIKDEILIIKYIEPINSKSGTTIAHGLINRISNRKKLIYRFLPK